MWGWVAAGVGLLWLASRKQGVTVDTSKAPMKVPVTVLMKIRNDWGASDWKELAAIAGRLRMNPADLLLVLTSESRLDPTAVNPRGSSHPTAVGLNQLTSAANGTVGITEDTRLKVPSMDVSDQLPLVERYFRGIDWFKTGKSYPDAGVVYEANFAPAKMARGMSSDTVLYTKEDGGAYEQNKGLDTTGKGYIALGDLRMLLRRTINTPEYYVGLQSLRKATGNDKLAANIGV